MPRRAVLVFLALLDLPAAAGAESAAAVLAGQLPTEEAQCRFLLELCHAAAVAAARVEGTPWGGDTDALIFKQRREAELHAADARAAAGAIERKNGRRLPCFDDPECACLRE